MSHPELAPRRGPGAEGRRRRPGRPTRRAVLAVAPLLALTAGAVAVPTPAGAQMHVGPVSAWGAPDQGGSTCTAPGCGTSPLPVTGVPSASRIYGGSDVSLAVAGGTVWAWGNNVDGQLGQGNTNPYPGAVEVPGITTAVAVAGGDENAFALLANGTVLAWGSNGGNALGFPNTGPVLSPTPVPGVTGAKAIAAAATSGYALLSTGSVMSWGSNDVGQLGNGTFGGKEPPAVIPNLRTVNAIWAGRDFAGALTKKGTLYTWGLNTFGQLGNGLSTNTDAPGAILTKVAQFELGGDNTANGHGLALLKNRTVVAWGCNSQGQLGDGTLTNHPLPQPVPGLSQIIQVAAHGAHSLALDISGNVWSWGANDQGQVGNGGTEPVTAPVEVLRGALAIAAGALTSLAIT